jgi:hypothetical protein
MEDSCAKGNKIQCEVVESYYTKRPADLDRELMPTVEQECRSGNRDSCAVLQQRKRHIERLQQSCASGNKQACDRLSNLAQ